MTTRRTAIVVRHLGARSKSEKCQKEAKCCVIKKISRSILSDADGVVYHRSSENQPAFGDAHYLADHYAAGKL